jgi:hypothetical protein
MKWDLKLTAGLVEKCFGQVQSEKFYVVARSIIDRHSFLNFHYSEFNKLVEFNIAPLFIKNHPLEILLGKDPSNTEKYFCAQTQVRAHVSACVQNIHAIGDTMAFAIATSLGLDIGDKPMQLSKITLRKIMNEKEMQLGSIACLLKEIENNKDFNHISAIVNHSKHQSIIQPYFHFDATGQDPDLYRIKFIHFKHKSIDYPRAEVKPLLESTVSWLSDQIVKCGIELNVRLGKGKPCPDDRTPNTNPK